MHGQTPSLACYSVMLASAHIATTSTCALGRECDQSNHPYHRCHPNNQFQKRLAAIPAVAEALLEGLGLLRGLAKLRCGV